MTFTDETPEWFVYILYNPKRDKTYVGYTSDLSRRMLRHNNCLSHKKTSYTYKNSGIWIPIYIEKYLSHSDAIKREKWFKSGVGREFIQENLANWIRISS